MATSTPTFCGECGAPLGAGSQFCGECGTAVPWTPPPVEVAPQRQPAPNSPPLFLPQPPRPPAKAAAAPPASANQLCPSCRGSLKPGKRYCPMCGLDLLSQHQTTSTVRPRAPEASPPPVAPVAAPPKRKSRALKAILGFVVPIVSLAVTFYMTRLIFGTMLAQQFGDLARQVVAMIVSIAAGGITRQIMKSRSARRLYLARTAARQKAFFICIGRR